MNVLDMIYYILCDEKVTIFLLLYILRRVILSMSQRLLSEEGRAPLMIRLSYSRLS